MKKLMFGIVAAAACSAMAEITSSNVVGYQANAVGNYGQLVTPSFVNVGGGTYSLQNLLALGADDKAATIQVLGADGTWQNGIYYWWNADGDYPAGWFDSEGMDKPAVNLKPGEGVFFSTLATGVSLQSAGEVSKDATAEVAVGGCIVGNPTPVACKLSEVTIVGAEVADKAATIQVLGADGNWQNGFYYWWNADGDYPAGWFDSEGMDKPEITIPAGGAIFISTAVPGVKLQFPTIL